MISGHPQRKLSTDEMISEKLMIFFYMMQPEAGTPYFLSFPCIISDCSGTAVIRSCHKSGG